MHLAELHILAAVEQFLQDISLEDEFPSTAVNLFVLTGDVFRYLIIQHSKAPFAYHYEIQLILSI
jgi:hypothetical protein